MKIAITGAAGLLGSAAKVVFSTCHDVLPLTHQDMEITNQEQVSGKLRQLHPEIVFHTAAIPDPDICEREPERAFAVNVRGTQNVLNAAKEIGAVLAHISSDAVFDGEKDTAYVEEDTPNPIGVYGRTKLEAERAVQQYERSYIFRVSVLFGPGKENFVSKGLRKLEAGESYVVASDQIGCATYTLDAAEEILHVIDSGKFGLYHLANSGACSRLELAQQAAKLAGLDTSKVIGKPLAEMKRDGPRSKYAVMEFGALRRNGFKVLRPWTEALADYIRAYERRD